MAVLAPVVEPDLEFKRQIIGLGADRLVRCYQCGTCSVVCPHSSAEHPFPRGQVLAAQWGLKERVLSDPAIWLCHGCAQCSTYCPRDAAPARTMAALRAATVAHFAVPAFMGRALADPRWLPLLFAVPLLVFLAILGARGMLTALPDGPVVFSKLVPILAVETVFVVAIALAMLGALTGALHYWHALGGPPASQGVPALARWFVRRFDGRTRVVERESLLFSPGRGATAEAGDNSPRRIAVMTIVGIFRHRKFRDCRARPVGTRDGGMSHLAATHLAVFYGFLGLIVTTTAVGLGIYAFGYPTPWPLAHPVKLLGNASGVVGLAGLAVLAWRRLANRSAGTGTSYSEGLFLAVLAATVLTGFLSQIFRLADAPRLAYPMYVVHLVVVFFLLAYAPYSKFAHVVYRSVAMLFVAAELGRVGEPASVERARGQRTRDAVELLRDRPVESRAPCHPTAGSRPPRG